MDDATTTVYLISVIYDNHFNLGQEILRRSLKKILQHLKQHDAHLVPSGETE